MIHNLCDGIPIEFTLETFGRWIFNIARNYHHDNNDKNQIDNRHENDNTDYNDNNDNNADDIVNYEK